MGKTFDMGINDVTFLADTDLADYQYYCVTSASTEHYVKLADGSDDPAPIGVLQTDTASAAGDPVSVRMFGPTKAMVAAATSANTACDIDMGHYLQATASGWLAFVGGGGPNNARSLEFLDSGCAIINVFFHGWAACAAGDEVY